MLRACLRSHVLGIRSSGNLIKTVGYAQAGQASKHAVLLLLAQGRKRNPASSSLPLNRRAGALCLREGPDQLHVAGGDADVRYVVGAVDRDALGSR
jgi:hypothetical protein